MKTFLVANPKGGCGKTTIAINLAGYFARRGQRVVLSDLDRQRSALGWLARRPAHLPTIHPWDGRDAKGFGSELDPEIVILDAPAGMRGERLKIAVKHVDRVLIPVQPSPLDMEAADDFLAFLMELKRVRKGKCHIALVGSRINSRALSAGQLEIFFRRLELPVVGQIRDTQVYVHAAAEGSTLFDLPRYRVARDLKQWRNILKWVDEV